MEEVAALAVAAVEVAAVEVAAVELTAVEVAPVVAVCPPQAAIVETARVVAAATGISRLLLVVLFMSLVFPYAVGELLHRAHGTRAGINEA